MVQFSLKFLIFDSLLILETMIGKQKSILCEYEYSNIRDYTLNLPSSSSSSSHVLLSSRSATILPYQNIPEISDSNENNIKLHSVLFFIALINRWINWPIAISKCYRILVEQRHCIQNNWKTLIIRRPTIEPTKWLNVAIV